MTTTPAVPTNDRGGGPDRTTMSAHKRWALAVIAACQLLVVLSASVVNIALPQAQRALGISDADRSWVVTAYTLGVGGLLLLGGRIADYTVAAITTASYLAQHSGLVEVAALHGYHNAFLVGAIV
ncbi:hypothetical protein [uncultured Friedmanniella sp.]|uniref:hypothetical protein n=1 Tax=uncultured Friedmanniella sp. TaxID=335381 RepID=UPI0035CBC895